MPPPYPASQSYEDIEILTPLHEVMGFERYHINAFYAYEGISELCLSTLHIRVYDDHPPLRKALIEVPMTCRLRYHGGERFFHGYISHIQKKPIHDPKDTFTDYAITFRPKLWFQSLTKNYRIFQHQTLHHIIHTLLAEYADMEVHDHSKHSGRIQRDYLVQYGESHLDFLMRLLHGEGFLFHISHHAQGSTFHLYDDVGQFPHSTNHPITMEHARIEHATPHTLQEFRSTLSATAHQYAYADYDADTPHAKLFVKTLMERPHPDLYYSYPGSFKRLDEGEDRVKKLRDGFEWREHVMRGRSTACEYTAGTRYSITHHPDASYNQSYTMLNVHHFWARMPEYHALHPHMDEMIAMQTSRDRYFNQITCLPSHIPFAKDVPPLPQAPSHQSARVVGPVGESIYTDQQGRIKIQFFWDQRGHFDEHSSCWVRVSHPLSGPGFGACVIPRVGSEVIVGFLNGDINQPIVLGCVYNGEHTPPLNLPFEQTHHIFKTRSLNTIPERYNEWRMVDTPFSEKIAFRAQKDFTIEMMDGNFTQTNHKGDVTQHIENGHFTHTLDQGDYSLSLSFGGLTHRVGAGSITHSVGTGSITHSISQGNYSVSIAKGGHAISIAQGDMSITLENGTCTLKVKGPIHIETDQTLDITANTLSVTCTNAMDVKAKNIQLKGETISIEASGELSLKGNPLKKEGETS